VGGALVLSVLRLAQGAPTLASVLHGPGQRLELVSGVFAPESALATAFYDDSSVQTSG
jgi:hypothetical protein